MTENQIEDKQTAAINTSQLPDGVYVIEIMTENQILSQKFIVSHN